MSGFDVAEAIAAFMADSSRDTLELPHMTTGQRKQTKKLMVEYPELRCESYGFGSDRQLHVFKSNATKALQAVVPAAHETHEGPIKSAGKDNPDFLAGVQDPCQAADGSDCSTSASGKEFEEPSDGSESPSVQKREVKASAFQDVAVVHVRNTFIHVEAASTDERVVQSMPHGMFGQCLAAERSQKDTKAHERDSEITPPPSPPPSGLAFSPGALVIVEGLEKAPAFNGLSAVVQNWDDACGRYTILIGSVGVNGGCQQAKVKEENLRLLLPCP
jgi:hypothetical protein